MGGLALDIDVNDKDAREILLTADEDIEKGADDALDDIGEEIRVNMVRQLFRQGSVKTGTGHRSLRVRNVGEGRRFVVGRRYLLGLEHGTQPHTPRTNYRLSFWANSEGWSVDGIVKHIQRYGTRPNPFVGVSVDRAVTSLDDFVVKNISKRLDS